MDYLSSFNEERVVESEAINTLNTSTLGSDDNERDYLSIRHASLVESDIKGNLEANICRF